MKKLKPNQEVEFLRLIYPISGNIRLDWAERWIEAGEQVKWKGVTDKEKRKARVDSPIWSMLSTLYPDGTKTSTPPFAINSGWGWLTEDKEKIHAELESDEDEIDEDEVIKQLKDEQIQELFERGRIVIEV